MDARQVQSVASPLRRAPPEVPEAGGRRVGRHAQAASRGSRGREADSAGALLDSGAGAGGPRCAPALTFFSTYSLAAWLYVQLYSRLVTCREVPWPDAATRARR